jgi:hypothetical protein
MGHDPDVLMKKRKRKNFRMCRPLLHRLVHSSRFVPRVEGNPPIGYLDLPEYFLELHTVPPLSRVVSHHGIFLILGAFVVLSLRHV